MDGLPLPLPLPAALGNDRGHPRGPVRGPRSPLLPGGHLPGSPKGPALRPQYRCGGRGGGPRGGHTHVRTMGNLRGEPVGKGPGARAGFRGFWPLVCQQERAGGRGRGPQPHFPQLRPHAPSICRGVSALGSPTQWLSWAGTPATSPWGLHLHIGHRSVDPGGTRPQSRPSPVTSPLPLPLSAASAPPPPLPGAAAWPQFCPPTCQACSPRMAGGRGAQGGPGVSSLRQFVWRDRGLGRFCAVLSLVLRAPLPPPMSPLWAPPHVSIPCHPIPQAPPCVLCPSLPSLLIHPPPIPPGP